MTTPLSITATREGYLTISSDTYKKSSIDIKISTINTNISAKRDISDSYTKDEVNTEISNLVGGAVEPQSF